MDNIIKNFVINIYDKEKVTVVENKIRNCGTINFLHTGDLYSTRSNLNIEDCIFNIIGFKFESESQEKLNLVLCRFINDLDDLNVNYLLKDFDSNEVIRSFYFEYR